MTTPLVHSRSFVTALTCAESPLDASVLEEVERWLERYLLFIGTAEPFRVALSLQSNRTFWLVLPEVILAMFSRRCVYWLTGPEF